MTLEIRTEAEVVWRRTVTVEAARKREGQPDRYGGKTWTDELPDLDGDFTVRGRVDDGEWHSTNVSGERSDATAILLVYDAHGLTVGASKEGSCAGQSENTTS